MTDARAKNIQQEITEETEGTKHWAALVFRLNVCVLALASDCASTAKRVNRCAPFGTLNRLDRGDLGRNMAGRYRGDSHDHEHEQSQDSRRLRRRPGGAGY
jgi:hypothetical protein